MMCDPEKDNNAIRTGTLTDGKDPSSLSGGQCTKHTTWPSSNGWETLTARTRAQGPVWRSVDESSAGQTERPFDGQIIILAHYLLRALIHRQTCNMQFYPFGIRIRER